MYYPSSYLNLNLPHDPTGIDQAIPVKYPVRQGKAKGEVLARSPYWITDYWGGSCTIWDSVREREGFSTPAEIINNQAKRAQVTLPQQPLSPEELDQILRSQFEAKVWEVVNGFFINCLSNEENKFADTSRAKWVSAYLANKIDQGGRGYSPALFRLPGQSTGAGDEAFNAALAVWSY